MKNKIPLNSDLSFDTVKLLESRAVFLANSGGGKSYAIRKFAEGACEQVQTIIIDPEGEFSSLREKYDFILSGKGADVPVEVRSAALLATRLLELGKSAVIDLYELHPQERQRYVKIFCEALINAPKELYHPVFIVLDEAHEYAPEGKPSEATWAVEALASKGRKRGFCLIPATQRISKLSKNISAECNNKLIGRASQDIDMKRAGDELGFTKDRLKELRQLKPGEFFAFGPAISDEVIKVKIGSVKTSHAKVGYKGTMKTPPPSAVIKKILGELHDLPAEAEKEAKTVAELKAEIVSLKRQKPTIEKQIEYRNDPKEIQATINSTVKMVEDRMQTEFWKERDQWLNQIQNWFSILKQIGETMQEFQKQKGKKKTLKYSAVYIPEDRTAIKANPVFTKESLVRVEKIMQDQVPASGMTFAKKTDYVYTNGISNPQQRVLDTLMWLENAGMKGVKNQVAFFSEQSPTSSGYANNLSALRTGGYITYPSPGQIALTDLGKQSAFPQLKIYDSTDLHRAIQERLPKPQWGILDALIKEYAFPLTKSELAERSGQSINSSGYANNLSTLRSLGLIDYPSPGLVIALPVLFLK